MTCTPEPQAGKLRRLALPLAGLVLLCGIGGIGRAEPSGSAAELVAKAQAAIRRSDGIDAEIRLKEALKAGARREAVAAYMGEAYLTQGKPEDARKWLEPQQFTKATAATGFRALARLEMREGHLPEAGAAFDRAIAVKPDDADMWVEIGRLRYSGGEHQLALDAASYALEIDPANVRALEFQGQIVRDKFGLAAALPWFEAALKQDPKDIDVLGEYAATLGDLGRASEMLAVTREMLTIDKRNARAFYLQAVLAARAGDNRLARVLLNRAGDGVGNSPGAMLLDAILDIRSGSYMLAADKLGKLLKRQPANGRADELLARSLFLAGEHKAVVQRFSGMADKEGASPYLLTLVGRSFENLDDRARAAPYLDRAAMTGVSMNVAPVISGSRIGDLLASGNAAEADALASRNIRSNPQSAGFRIAAGDVRLAMQDGEGALVEYRKAAEIRMPKSLILKMVAAYQLAGEEAKARALVEAHLRQYPLDSDVQWQAAQMALSALDWKRARLLLEHMAKNGSGRDVSVLADLALARLRSGDAEAARDAALEAYRLQRSSPQAAETLGLVLATTGENPHSASALLAKAHKLLGETRLLAEARRRLALSRKS
ncbi:MAG: tetratricopeptide repeat protein [Novosphingobium sp.]|nr:tetratricopeptide repeat protein [Novosphingobium sp.]